MQSHSVSTENQPPAFDALLKKVSQSQSLTAAEAEFALEELIAQQISPVKMATFLSWLSAKRETSEELTGFVRGMRRKAVQVKSKAELLVDNCGTGGDQAGTFNFSTLAALVLAGAGLTVSKHGNRAVSSKCGSADLLAALGVKIDLKAQQVEECLAEVGLAFLFAPRFHPALKALAPIRKEMGVRTIFNITGPLLNPASPNFQLVGVFEKSLGIKMAKALYESGVKRGVVVHGADGLDEITLTADTFITEFNGEAVKEYVFSPPSYGFDYCSKAALSGGAPEENKIIAEKILSGGPLSADLTAKKNVVLLNAGALLKTVREVSFAEGIALARESLEGGQAKRKLTELVEKSNS